MKAERKWAWPHFGLVLNRVKTVRTWPTTFKTNRMHVNTGYICLTLQKKEKNIFWVIYVYLLVCEIRFFCTFLTKVTNRMHVNSGFLCLTLQEKKKKLILWYIFLLECKIRFFLYFLNLKNQQSRTRKKLILGYTGCDR